MSIAFSSPAINSDSERANSFLAAAADSIRSTSAFRSIHCAILFGNNPTINRAQILLLPRLRELALMQH